MWLGKDRSISKVKDAVKVVIIVKKLVQLKINFLLYTGMMGKVPGGQDSIHLIYKNINSLEIKKHLRK